MTRIMRLADKRFLDAMFGPSLATFRVDVVPLIREVYGDAMAHGEEALRLMDDDTLRGWLGHTFGWYGFELERSFLEARRKMQRDAGDEEAA